MNLFPDHITLNGNKTSIKKLIEKDSLNEEWEKDSLDFLKEWYSSENFIKTHTSGSTGNSKTIQLQKEFVAASALRTINYFGLKEGDKILHCLPSKFIAGKLMIVRALLGELDLHLLNPSSDFAFLEKEQFQFAAMVPIQVEKLLRLNSKDWKLNQLLIGGAAISSAMEAKLQNTQTACYSSYGMTETATHIAIRKINGQDSDSYFHCLKNISVGISKDNCLQINIQEPTKQILKTTDLAELKDNKTFRILGRSDNVIISGGAKYSPEKIEKKLENSVKIPFLISAKPHKALGQQIVLIIEGKEDLKLLKEIKEICKNKLEKFEQPGEILFLSQFPKNENGKIIRSKLY